MEKKLCEAILRAATLSKLRVSTIEIFMLMSRTQLTIGVKYASRELKFQLSAALGAHRFANIHVLPFVVGSVHLVGVGIRQFEVTRALADKRRRQSDKERRRCDLQSSSSWSSSSWSSWSSVLSARRRVAPTRFSASARSLRRRVHVDAAAWPQRSPVCRRCRCRRRGRRLLWTAAASASV